MNPSGAPNATTYLSAIRQRYPFLQQDDALMQELNRRAAQNTPVANVLGDAANYYQVQNGYNNMLKSTQVQPLTDQDRQGYTQQAHNEYDPAYQAAQAQNNQGYASLAERLKQNAGYAEAGANTQATNANAGLSGGAQAQQQYLRNDLTNSLNTADIQRTMDSANMALQNAQDVTNRSNDLYNQELARRGGNAAAGLQNLNNTYQGAGSIFGMQNQANITGMNQGTALSNILQSPFFHYLDPGSAASIIGSLGYPVDANSIGKVQGASPDYANLNSGAPAGGGQTPVASPAKPRAPLNTYYQTPARPASGGFSVGIGGIA